MDAYPPALELSRLSRHFGERVVLEDLTLSLPAGRTLVVFGPNGAGKTTLLRILAGLLRPHGGRVTVLGRELPREGFALRGLIGWLGHEPLLYRELSAHENLTFHARLHGLPSERVDEALGSVGMAARAHEPVRELSRGMVQRVAAARAVLAEPPLLLLDEPHANLDPAAREMIEPLIGRAAGCARVISSHDPVAGLAEADIVLGLRAGRAALLAEAGSVDRAAIMELYR
ncbi:MAG: heme ABC exporter ATP-binding protein CcmA [Acidobacteriota bacterium]|nr:heme ABC exporter ATP-binding protein CcmA [Acidobacteriota bacterium]